VLLVVPIILTMAVLFSAAMRLLVKESHASLGIIQSLKVVVVVVIDDLAFRHHL